MRVEIKALIDLMQAIGTPDRVFLNSLDAARSFVVLGRPLDALNYVDFLLSDVTRAQRRPRPVG